MVFWERYRTVAQCGQMCEAKNIKKHCTFSVACTTCKIFGKWFRKGKPLPANETHNSNDSPVVNVSEFS